MEPSADSKDHQHHSKQLYCKSSIPLWERVSYLMVWILLAAHAFYAVWVASDAHQNFITNDLESGGWKFINRLRDVTDEEWLIWWSTLWNGLGFWLLGHVIVGQITGAYFTETRAIVFMIYDTIAIMQTIGWRAVVIVYLQTAILFIVACVSASPLCVWILSALILLAFQFETCRQWLNIHGIFSADSMMSEYGIVMSLARATSSALTLCARRLQATNNSTRNCDCVVGRSRKVDERDSDNTNSVCQNIVNILCYVMYLPLYFTGPLMTFDMFSSQFHQPFQQWTRERVIPIVSLIARVALWTVFFEISQYYLYFHALFTKLSFVNRASLWAASGAGYLYGQFFMVKYFVLYGGSAALARIDQLSSLDPPCCISRVYRYSTVWRCFDRGLYCFMSRHIYFMVGGSRRGIVRRLVGTALCFMFVYIWHGLWQNIFYWILLNFVGIALEKFGDYVVTVPSVQRFEGNFLSAAWSQRLKAMFAIPLTAMSVFAIFTFFAGCEVGCVLFRRLLIDGFPLSTTITLFALYCFNHSCREIEIWRTGRRHNGAVDGSEHSKID